MRVRFTAPFDYVVLRSKSGTSRATMAYATGEQTVKREHGEAAVKAGKAVELEEPPTVDDAPRPTPKSSVPVPRSPKPPHPNTL